MPDQPPLSSPTLSETRPDHAAAERTMSSDATDGARLDAPSSYRSIVENLACYFRGRGYVAYGDAAKRLPPSGIEPDFAARWGSRPATICAAMEEILAPFSPCILATEGRWMRAFCPAVVIAQARKDEIGALQSALVQALRRWPRAWRATGSLVAMVCLSDVQELIRPSMDRYVLKWTTLSRTQAVLLAPQTKRIQYAGRPPLALRELELQAFGAWSGWRPLDAPDAAANSNIIMRVPTWLQASVGMHLIETLPPPYAVSYNDLTPTSPLDVSIIELMHRHRDLFTLEGFGEFLVTSQTTGSSVLLSSLQDIYLLSPQPAQRGMLLAQGLPMTKGFFQRNAPDSPADADMMGIRLVRERFKDMPFFRRFLDDFHLSMELPPGYGRR